MSVDAADVAVCATTLDTEAQCLSPERKAPTAFGAQVPRPAASVLLPTQVSSCPDARTNSANLVGLYAQSFLHNYGIAGRAPAIALSSATFAVECG